MKYDVIVIGAGLSGLTAAILLDIRGMTRRIKAGYFSGAKNPADPFMDKNRADDYSLAECENKCIRNIKTGTPVEIKAVCNYITNS